MKLQNFRAKDRQVVEGLIRFSHREAHPLES